MKQKKFKFWMLFVIFAIIELPFSLNLDKTLHVGTNPKTGNFSFWTTSHKMTLQQKIEEEFQPDEFLKESGERGKLYESEKLYDTFEKVFGKGKAIGAFNLIRVLIIVDLVWLFLAFYIRRALKRIPSKRQIIFESVYSFFEDLVVDTLGKERVHFTPYVLTIFLFIWSSNMLGLIPIPGFMEPTRNLNVPLGMGIMAVLVVHYFAIKHKGIGNYLKGYAEPLFFLAPLNLIGELSKAVSISFRLFGNILGGAIIILVVSSLVNFIVLPVGLNLFFGLFVGTIQAFVFTMLSLTYIAVEIND
jgi:F-type H+-transporting ATPase subunit a